MIRKIFTIAIFYLFFSQSIQAQIKSLEPIPLSTSWKSLIYQLSPDKPQVPASKQHKVLLFSLFTGYEHWVIPHVNYIISTLGEKSGVYSVVQSSDISVFQSDSLQQFDAIVFNNNCSVSDRRNLFYDALKANSNFTEAQKIEKAAELEKNLLSYVKNGGGLVVLHGGITMLNNSPEFSDMVGGSFNYHPPQQTIELQIADKNHPMTSAFEGKTFTHIDEPYFFKNSYVKKNFKPLLYMEISKIEELKHETSETISYVSWIKRFGKGRVFYCSASHNAQSYENKSLLKYYLNGIQYALGDLKCDDASIGQ